MNNDVRAGDVCASATGRNIVRVEKIEPYTPGFEWHEVHWRRLTKDRAPTGQSGKCGLHNFTRGRTLVERGGVRVGDVRADHEPLLVQSIEGGHAGMVPVQPDGLGPTWIPLLDVAAMPLVERAGKAV